MNYYTSVWLTCELLILSGPMDKAHHYLIQHLSHLSLSHLSLSGSTSHLDEAGSAPVSLSKEMCLKFSGPRAGFVCENLTRCETDRQRWLTGAGAPGKLEAGHLLQIVNSQPLQNVFRLRHWAITSGSVGTWIRICAHSARNLQLCAEIWTKRSLLADRLTSWHFH